MNNVFSIIRSKDSNKLSKINTALIFDFNANSYIFIIGPIFAHHFFYNLEKKKLNYLFSI